MTKWPSAGLCSEWFAGPSKCLDIWLTWHTGLVTATHAATTHLYGPGVRRHIKSAIRLGATREELLEVIQLTTIIGIHAVNLAVPILAEELEAVTAHETQMKTPSTPP
jgi:hypothetical protein